MPKDYEAVRDSCIKKKEKESGKTATKKQIASCKKMAAIWYFKKHGKPVTHTDASIKNRFKYDVTHLYNKDIYGNDHIESLNFLEQDNLIKIEKNSDNTIIAEIINIKMESFDSGFYFTQPFEKVEARYRLAEIDTEYGYPSRACTYCKHFVYANNIFDFDCGMCHLVQGVIETDYVCDYYATSLIVSTESEDEIKKEDTKKDDQ
jgi:hypothetical protein